MKSAVFYGKHDLRVEDSTKPTVGKRDVLINVKACRRLRHRRAYL